MLKKITILLSTSVWLFGIPIFYPLEPVEPIEATVQPMKAVTPKCAVYPIGEELDLDHSGTVDIADITKVTSAWGAKFGEAKYNPAYNLNSDKVIDIKDIMKIASQWGKTCHELHKIKK